MLMRLVIAIGILVLAPSGVRSQGAPTATAKDPSSTALSAEEFNKLIGHVRSCWAPPVSAIVRGSPVVLRMEFDRNGAMIGEPIVTSGPSDEGSAAMVESAKRAVKRCQPFPLPAGKYKTWRELEITFDAQTLSSPPVGAKSQK
jgi:hypothetical protein